MPILSALRRHLTNLSVPPPPRARTTMQASTLFLLAGAAAFALAAPAKPAFCKGLECPLFKVENSTSEYEIRHYDAALWAVTETEDYDVDGASRQSFMKLFHYISGENALQTKIEMTAPVTIVIKPGDGPFCKTTFRMGFFVPLKYQNPQGPPSPTSPDVKIESRPSMRVAVASYGGFSHQESMVNHLEKMKKALDRDQVAHSAVPYIYAGYDSPFTFVDRHNEVWVMLQ
eukprot:comp5570_c0_seq1/m.1485 comp5570_c0_seq1/g.1485  ORF comp5570_c0_seq1/g.1485 comp5570_c0_seq1/m.1485 type:complete len:230 (-) comp5570_c0_seq1:66-755(-)